MGRIGSHRFLGNLHDSRQTDREGRAAAGLALDGYVAAHHLAKPFADGEAKTRAAVSSLTTVAVTFVAAARLNTPLLVQIPCPHCKRSLDLHSSMIFTPPFPKRSAQCIIRRLHARQSLRRSRRSAHPCRTLIAQIPIAERAARPRSVHPAVSSLGGFRTPAPGVVARL